MYENITYEDVLQRCLAIVSQRYPDMDLRETSIVYNALAVIATERKMSYIEIDNFFNSVFVDTAPREYLIRKCQERGITPLLATFPIIQATIVSSQIVPNGTMFRVLETTIAYQVTEHLSGNLYSLTCVQSGETGNLSTGRLIVSGNATIQIISANITELSVPGEESESTEALRARYFQSLSAQAFGGNIRDYTERVTALPGIGGCKVYPVWNGGGTVRVAIIASDYSVPTTTLINNTQEAIDPPPQGQGVGFAPIGHLVTVTPVEAINIDVGLTITYDTGVSWGVVATAVQTVISDYMRSQRQAWATSESLVVRISQIESLLISVPGIVDVTNTTLNGDTNNLTLTADQVPFLGIVNG